MRSSVPYLLQLYRQIKQRSRFFERYRRTAEALHLGLDIRSTRPPPTTGQADNQARPTAGGSGSGIWMSHLTCYC